MLSRTAQVHTPLHMQQNKILGRTRGKTGRRTSTEREHGLRHERAVAHVAIGNRYSVSTHYIYISTKQPIQYRHLFHHGNFELLRAICPRQEVNKIWTKCRAIASRPKLLSTLGGSRHVTRGVY